MTITSGMLIWILIFRKCMPSTRGSVHDNWSVPMLGSALSLVASLPIEECIKQLFVQKQH